MVSGPICRDKFIGIILRINKSQVSSRAEPLRKNIEKGTEGFADLAGNFALFLVCLFILLLCLLWFSVFGFQSSEERLTLNA